MKQYHELLIKILREGTDKGDRTGTGTRSIFGHQMRFDLSTGFPLMTTKKVHMKSIIHELIWFLKGDTNIKYLQDNGVKIWDAWADENGDLGPVYPEMWRLWGVNSIDQISNVIEELKDNPDSRRLVVSSWDAYLLPDNNKSFVDNVREGKQALPPCHCLFQFYVVDGKLSCQLYQRSGDAFLGVPFNIASYSLLTMLIADVCGLGYGDFIHTLGDAHIYNNHKEAVMTQLGRSQRPLPVMSINTDKLLDDLSNVSYDMFELTEYDPHPAIKGKVAV